MSLLRQSTGPLTIERMPHPDGRAEVPIFDDWQSACVHLQRHLLTAPECHAWAMVDPEIAAVVDLDDFRARWSWAQEGIATRGASLQGLYERFCRAVRRASGDAARLGWKTSHGGVMIALGTEGILMVIATTLKTAFLPGQGDPAAVVSAAESGGPRPDSPVPKARGMRSGRGGSAGPDSRRDRERRDRQADWSESQRLYYGVFRPSVQFIRSQYHRGLDVRGRRLSDYGLLKPVLPPLSRLKYHDWLELRETAQRP
jgi:hypothetical protein